MTGCPRKAGRWSCSTEAKKASMSISRIIRPSGRPGLAEHPARAARVVAKLVGFVAMTFDGEVGEPMRALPPGPFPRHPFHANHPPLPAEPQRTNPPGEEHRDDVDGLMERLEHE